MAKSSNRSRWVFENRVGTFRAFRGEKANPVSPLEVEIEKIIVEIKAVESLHQKHSAQLMNYLKATGHKLGLLVNFGAYPKVDIRRIVV